MIDLKKLLEIEEDKRKKVFFDNLCYIEYYILGFILCGDGILLGVEQKELQVVIRGYILLYFMITHSYILPLMYEKEQGVWHNVFYKYRDIPVSMQQLYRTKMQIACKQIVKTTLIYQAFAVIGRLIEGMGFTRIGMLLFPTIYGLVMILVLGLWMYVCKRRAEA